MQSYKLFGTPRLSGGFRDTKKRRPRPSCYLRVDVLNLLKLHGMSCGRCALLWWSLRPERLRTGCIPACIPSEQRGRHTPDNVSFPSASPFQGSIRVFAIRRNIRTRPQRTALPANILRACSRLTESPMLILNSIFLTSFSSLLGVSFLLKYNVFKQKSMFLG